MVKADFRIKVLIAWSYIYLLERRKRGREGL